MDLFVGVGLAATVAGALLALAFWRVDRHAAGLQAGATALVALSTGWQWLQPSPRGALVILLFGMITCVIGGALACIGLVSKGGGIGL